MAYKSPLILGTSGYPAQIQSGDTLSLSSLGTGTANSTTYLRGDGTWQTITSGGLITEQEFTASAGQTTFTITGGYIVGSIKVVVNGIELFASDFTATDGTTVVLSTATILNDIVKVTKYSGAVTALNVSDDTTTNASFYPTISSISSGTNSTITTSSTKLYFNPSIGTLNATGFNSLSDVNKKKNIETICNATATVLALRGVTYDWKESNRKSMGVIAQELENVVPYLVTTNETGEKSVLYGNLVGLLIEAIKEQQVEINKLKDICNANL